MKAKIWLLLLTLAMAAAVGFAAEGLPWWSYPWTESFRSASTASLLDDDLDIMLDPARMTSIEGYRLYTQLSNIFDKNEEVFGEHMNNNYYMIGGCGPIKDFGKLGLIYDYNFNRSNDTTRTNATSIDYSGSIPISREVDDQTGYSGVQTQDTHWWLGFGKEMGFGKAGVLFYHLGRYNKTQPADERNMKEEIQLTDLVTNQLESMSTLENSYTEDYIQNVWGGALSFWRPMTDKLDLGLALGLNAYMANEYDTLLHHYEYTNPAAGGNSIVANRKEYWDIIPHDHVGSEINVRLAGVWKWSDNVTTRTDVAFTTLSGSRDDGKMSNVYDSSAVFVLPTGTRSYVINSTEEAPAVHQEDSYSALEFFSKTTAHLGEKVVLGMGLGFGSYKRDYLTSYAGTYNQSQIYNDGEPMVWGDYILYVNANADYKENYTEAMKILVAPVGLEFKLTDNFVIRLGARHNFIFRDTTDNVSQIYTNPVVTQINPNTNDTIQGVTFDPYDNENAVYQSGKRSWNETYYTYGAGWTISEHLQLDFMGYAALTDLHHWKLSAVIKF